MIPTLYLGVMGQPGSIRGACGTPSLLPVHFGLQTLFDCGCSSLSELRAALPIRGSRRSVALPSLIHHCGGPFPESPYRARLAKTCRFLQASMD
jgi:hypothetical protein